MADFFTSVVTYTHLSNVWITSILTPYSSIFLIILIKYKTMKIYISLSILITLLNGTLMLRFEQFWSLNRLFKTLYIIKFFHLVFLKALLNSREYRPLSCLSLARLTCVGLFFLNSDLFLVYAQKLRWKSVVRVSVDTLDLNTVFFL